MILLTICDVSGVLKTSSLLHAEKSCTKFLSIDLPTLDTELCKSLCSDACRDTVSLTRHIASLMSSCWRLVKV